MLQINAQFLQARQFRLTDSVQDADICGKTQDL